MLLHGSFIYKNNNSATFLFWGENGSTEYKKRGRAAAGAMPIYPGLVKPEEVLQVLGFGNMDEEPDGKTGSAGIYRLEPGEHAGEEDSRILPYEIKGISYTPWTTLLILLSVGDRALVFTQFAEMGEILRKLIKRHMKTDVFFLHGGVPRKTREEMVEAKVQGSRPRPYSVKIEMDRLSYANPCKHIAAVYYAIGQEFDRDPFMIFRLRGIDREALMNQLRKARGGEVCNSMESLVDNGNSISLGELMEEMKRFKGLDAAITEMSFSYEPPGVPYGVLKRLGPMPFFKEKEVFEKLMILYYDGAARKVKGALEQR